MPLAELVRWRVSPSGSLQTWAGDMKEDEDDTDITSLHSGHSPSFSNLLPVVRVLPGQGNQLETYLQVSVVSFYVVSYEQERKR